MYLDAHTHLTALTWFNMEDMSVAGITTVVSPVNFSSVRAVASSTIKDVWDQQIEFHLDRASKNLINAYAMIGVSMVAIPKDPENLLKILPEYLKKESVVAIGEIGFEPSSRTCKDLKIQESIVRSQIEIALDMDIPIVFHVPHSPENKTKFTAKTLDICNEIGFPMHRVTIDHSSAANIEMVLNAGAMVGITVQPWRDLKPDDAAELVLKYGPENIIINSDCGNKPSDPLAVAKTAFSLKLKGVSEQDIEKVCWSNAKSFYNI
jgi:hypothetical protein